MAFYSYFADMPDGSVLEFKDSTRAVALNNGSHRYYRVGARVQQRGKGWVGFDDTAGEVKITRVIKMKSNPSRHECDARCMYATGKTMQCECSCGGRNHGKGSFSCETVETERSGNLTAYKARGPNDQKWRR